MLQVDHLCFGHPGQPALFDGWSAALPAGLTLIEGDTGSGKTSLLRLLAGALRGTGEITLAGRRIDTDPAVWRREVCWIDPRDPAWDALHPDELMAAQRVLHPEFDGSAWQRHLDAFDLQPHRAKAMFMLSTGTRRKVALAWCRLEPGAAPRRNNGRWSQSFGRCPGHFAHLAHPTDEASMADLTAPASRPSGAP